MLQDSIVISCIFMQKGWQEIFILPSFILFIENFYGKLAILSMSP